MDTAKHTPGPWTVDTTVALGAYGVWTEYVTHPGYDGAGYGSPVCFMPMTSEERKLVSREARDANATLIAASPDMAAALYFLGGGSTYLEMHGRLCFCSAMGKPDDAAHATACLHAYKAWQKAGSPIEDR